MKIKFLILFAAACLTLSTNAQRKTAASAAGGPDEGFRFTTLVELKATPVKNQASTGTCWCFATTSFIESELLRKGKGEYDLSEMFIVRYNYIDRLKDNYLRQGKGNLGPGSLSHDFMRVFSNTGIVPDEVYAGLNYGSPTHNHGELQAFINSIASVPVQRKRESDQYRMIANAVLDTYLGKVPEYFTYRGVTHTPESFAKSLEIDPDDYVQITSFTHFPFYTKGVLEVPDNWSMERFYNVPLDELIEIMDYSFNNGYTVNWDGDVSERGFSHANGVAINPVISTGPDLSTTDRARFERTPSPAGAVDPFSFARPVPEINVTQQIRQAGYENFTTTDDHLMHMTGVVKDQNGTKYYITKNSWGTERNKSGGYLNISESFVRAKTIFIMVHKDGVPPAIRTKLGF
ncbi:MAG: aminopeptidase [Bacteroidales bacterium]|nr:aminopeptidase [Bacteroidales bacterium]